MMHDYDPFHFQGPITLGLFRRRLVGDLLFEFYETDEGRVYGRVTNWRKQRILRLRWL